MLHVPIRHLHLAQRYGVFFFGPIHAQAMAFSTGDSSSSVRYPGIDGGLWVVLSFRHHAFVFDQYYRRVEIVGVNRCIREGSLVDLGSA